MPRRRISFKIRMVSCASRALLYQQALVTPSCGLATETVERAERTMDALVDLSSLLREREGFA